MRRNAAPSFAALATVLVTMLVLGVFIPIVQATNGAANSVRSRVEVDVYMKTNANAADSARVRRELLDVPHVKSVQFVSKAAAYRQQSKIDPAAYKLLGHQPAARHLPRDPGQPGQRARRPQRAHASDGAAAAPARSTSRSRQVSNKRTDTKKILEVTNLVTITAAALTVLLTIASVLLIANTIRLSLYARRREVEVMKLVGATDWFIRWPFVIEGIVVGAAGALLAHRGAGGDQDRPARSAGRQLDADRGAADDLVHRAARRADGRRGAGVRARLRAVAAALPARVAARAAAPASAGPASSGAQLPWIAADVHASSTFSCAGHGADRASSCCSSACGSAATPAGCRGPCAARSSPRDGNDKLVNQVLGADPARLLPQGRPLRSGQQGPRRGGGQPQRPVLALLRPELTTARSRTRTNPHLSGIGIDIKVRVRRACSSRTSSRDPRRRRRDWPAASRSSRSAPPRWPIARPISRPR